jgi:hypothetical protein
MYGDGIINGLSFETVIMMTVAAIGYALYISGEHLDKKAAKKGASSLYAGLLKKAGGPLMLGAIAVFVMRWLVNKL